MIHYSLFITFVRIAKTCCLLKLSVIIVNYNVKYFLEQCLHSVHRAVQGLEAEVIVVDNASSDNSLSYLQPRFTWVQWLGAESNLGFGRACNLGLQKSTGDVVLFLNPDTLVAEESFATCLRFFDAHPDCGALGVQMIDGTGAFLKESKRSFPSPLTSFYKLSGLTRLFPRSAVFGRYHLGHLNKDENHVVDVLAGAYLMVRREVLQKTGGFDERFFMYGEDVDLSYRIQKTPVENSGGPFYKNYYLAETTIIHFKGESTKRGSLNYVRMFYQAMSLFVHKHYGGTRAGVFTASIQLAIWLRAGFTAFGKLLRWVGLPALDALLILLSFWLVKEAWLGYVRTDVSFSGRLLLLAFPAFTATYLVVAYYAGLYDKYFKIANLIRSTFIATVGLLALYALLPESYRFSRGVVVFGATLAFVLIGLLRWVAVKTGLLQLPAGQQARPGLLVAASQKDFDALHLFLTQKTLHQKIIGRIAIDENSNGAIARLPPDAGLVKALHAEEMIFCTGELSYKETIAATATCGRFLKLRYHASGSSSVVGSDASTASGETISLSPRFALSKAGNRRTKRLIDVVAALLFLLSFPAHLLLQKNRGQFFRHCFAVLAGRLTWIGYVSPDTPLPKLRPGVLGANGLPRSHQQQLPADTRQQIDFWYAHDWEGWDDIRLIVNSYPHLGHAEDQ